MLRTYGAVLVAISLLAGVLPATAQPGYGQPGYGPPNSGYNDRNQRGYASRPGYGDWRQNQASGGYADQQQSWRRRYQREYSYRDDNYYKQCRNQVDPAGVIAGALIGGLLGNAMARRGNSAIPTIAGVVVGGALGGMLTKDMNCEDQSYAYNTYYNGFNSGRVNVPYQWRNPNNGNYGDFRVNNYYNDPAGFRCAEFNHQAYVNRNSRSANGRACQQPDGTWAILN